MEYGTLIGLFIIHSKRLLMDSLLALLFLLLLELLELLLYLHIMLSSLQHVFLGTLLTLFSHVALKVGQIFDLLPLQLSLFFLLRYG